MTIVGYHCDLCRFITDIESEFNEHLMTKSHKEQEYIAEKFSMVAGKMADHPKKGTKNDIDKPDLSLIPKDAMWEMAKAFTFGCNKYGRYNYKEGIEITRLLAGAMRHITQFNDGEDIDKESGVIHLGNAMAGLAMAIDMFKNKPEMDNRYKGNK